VHNKLDLLPERANSKGTDDAVHVFTSAKTGAGFDQLKQALLGLAGWEPSGESVYMARERHLDALRKAATRLAEAECVFGEPELFAEELRLAQRDLEGVTGKFTADDLLGEIFARFCIGK